VAVSEVVRVAGGPGVRDVYHHRRGRPVWRPAVAGGPAAALLGGLAAGRLAEPPAGRLDEPPAGPLHGPAAGSLGDGDPAPC
jgi:hypothetical protein